MRDTRVRRESAGFVMEGIVDGGSRGFASAGDFEGSAFRYGGERELGRGDSDDSVEGSGSEMDGKDDPGEEEIFSHF